MNAKSWDILGGIVQIGGVVPGKEVHLTRGVKDIVGPQMQIEDQGHLMAQDLKEIGQIMEQVKGGVAIVAVTQLPVPIQLNVEPYVHFVVRGTT